MAGYYAIERSGEYLCHYGIRGMRWRVRKAIRKGNERAYERQYRKATKHLEQLEKQANNGAKYTRKALRKGVGLAGSFGTVAMGIGAPEVLAYKAAVTGYNAYRAVNTANAAKRAKAFRKAMEQEFDPGQLFANQQRKKRRYHRS